MTEALLEYEGIDVTKLSGEEIKKYLLNRWLTLDITKRRKLLKKHKGTIEKQLLEIFYKIAGVNTAAVYKIPCCKKEFSLMYRHDIQRFSDKMFLGTTTYWD